jgi:DNA invertase Pin-like site-specific DNA recombinase
MLLLANHQGVVEVTPTAGGDNFIPPSSGAPTVIPTGDRRVAAYLRRSRKIENDSIERQTERTTLYAQERLKSPITHFYADKGKSGETRHRVQFKQMMADAQRGLFNTLVIEAIDRLGRTLSIIAGVCEQLEKLGIEIHSLQKGDVINSVDVAFQGLAATQHQSLLKKRTYDGIWRGVVNGKQSNLVWGYKMVLGKPGQRVVDETLRPHIEWMFDARVDGMTLNQIAEAFNQRGIPKRYADSPWVGGNIQSLIRNPIFAGYYVFGRERKWRDHETDKEITEPRPQHEWKVIWHPHCQIVSEDKWNAANATLPKLIRRSYGRTLLSARIHCAHCDSVMNSNAHGKYPNYRCVARDHFTAIEQRVADKFTLDCVRECLMDDSFEILFREEFERRHREAFHSATEQRAELAARAKELKTLLIKVLDDEMTSNYPRDIVKERANRLTEEYQRVAQRLATLPAEPQPLRKIDTDRRRTLLQAFDRLYEIVDDFLMGDVSELTDTERQTMAALRSMVKRAEVERIEGTARILMRLTLHLPRVYGIDVEHGEADFYEKKFESIYYTQVRKGTGGEIAQAYRSGTYFWTDSEFEAIMLGNPELLEINSDPTMLRAALDGLVFIISSGAKLGYLGLNTGRLEERSLRTLMRRIARSKSWVNLCHQFKDEFPERFALFRMDRSAVGNMVKDAIEHRRPAAENDLRAAIR